MANIDRIKLPNNSEYNLQARVIGAVNGNVAVMDGNGNVADSGESLANIENAVVANLIPTRLLPDTNASNGVHWTTNTDGTVRIYTDAGGATADAWIGLIRQADKLTIPDGTFTASLNETTGISLSIFCSDKISSATVSTYALVTNSGSFTKSDGDTYYTGASLKVASGTVITTPVVIKPMLEVGLKAHSYVPYAPTNRELMLNKADASAIAPTEDGTTASKAYAVGEHFIRGGKYCVCIAAITSGGTFTLNTNYIETQIGALPSKYIINYMVGNALSSVVADGNGTCTFPIYLPFATSITKSVTIAVTGQLRVHKAGGGYSDVTLSATGFLQGNILSLVASGLDANAVYGLDSATGGTITITF